MKFQEALKLMQEGKQVKLPSWGGYWYWDEENKTVMIRCKDDTVLDIRETQVVEYTLLNVASGEWIVADEMNTPILGGVATFNFGEAIKYIKRGCRIARKGWNGKGMFIYLFSSRIVTCNDVECGLEDIKIPLAKDHKDNYELSDFIVMKTVDGKIIPWNASQADMLAEDWVFVD